MNSTGYKLLGYAAWHGGRWYLRRRYLSKLPSRRKAATIMLASLLTVAALGALWRHGRADRSLPTRARI